MDEFSSKSLMRLLIKEYETVIARHEEAQDRGEKNLYGSAWRAGYINGIRSAIATMTGTHGIPTPVDGGVPDWLPMLREWVDE